MKLIIKKLLATSLSRVGPYCPAGWLEDVLLLRLSSYLMDERVLPRRAVPRPLRGTNAMLLCNPYIPTHKRLFWCGRLEQRAIESYLRRELRPGDTFIDVGSNYGHLSILASFLVGKAGRVIAFDANEPLANVLIIAKAASYRMFGFMRSDWGTPRSMMICWLILNIRGKVSYAALPERRTEIVHRLSAVPFRRAIARSKGRICRAECV